MIEVCSHPNQIGKWCLDGVWLGFCPIERPLRVATCQVADRKPRPIRAGRYEIARFGTSATITLGLKNHSFLQNMLRPIQLSDLLVARHTKRGIFIKTMIIRTHWILKLIITGELWSFWTIHTAWVIKIRIQCIDQYSNLLLTCNRDYLMRVPWLYEITFFCTKYICKGSVSTNYKPFARFDTLFLPYFK